MRDIYHKGKVQRPSSNRVAARYLQAAVSFKEMKSPLDYGGGKVQRIALCDSSITTPDDLNPYFEDLEPCIAGFLDFSPYNGDSLYIHYMATRSDSRGKGYAKKLVGEFYKRHSKKVKSSGTMNWGDLMHPGARALYRMMKDKHHPGIYHKGKFR